MSVLAFILDDTPPEWRVLTTCIYSSCFSVLCSWLLIRWRKETVFIALTSVTVINGITLMPLGRISEWIGVIEGTFLPREAHAIWFSMIFPYAMIGLFYFTKKEPNQHLRATGQGKSGGEQSLGERGFLADE